MGSAVPTGTSKTNLTIDAYTYRYSKETWGANTLAEDNAILQNSNDGIYSPSTRYGRSVPTTTASQAGGDDGSDGRLTHD